MLGEFENIDDYDGFGWILFILATIFNMIIMFNMLVTLFLKTLDKFYDARFLHVPATTVSLVYDVHDILHSSFCSYTTDERCMFFVWELNHIVDADVITANTETVDELTAEEKQAAINDSLKEDMVSMLEMMKKTHERLN